jgi:hypothetical protein
MQVHNELDFAQKMDSNLTDNKNEKIIANIIIIYYRVLAMT